MRTTRALAAAATAVAVLGVVAPAATARDGAPVGPIGPSNIVALPSVVARGGQVTITVDGCPQGGTASSDAFRRTALFPVGDSTAKGRATVDSRARPGAHSITVHCTNSGRQLTHPNAFTVIGGVRGGLGGSTSTGATPTDMAIGGGLIALAVVGGGVFWMRRRTEKRI